MAFPFESLTPRLPKCISHHIFASTFPKLLAENLTGQKQNTPRWRIPYSENAGCRKCSRYFFSFFFFFKEGRATHSLSFSHKSHNLCLYKACAFSRLIPIR
ncbi:hypothetical protein BSKO_06993 [Bryopsis sp. KO-2023]|nr:hypothetical protein BSKO_06993 [Bryopsis sp. KO-2023]